MTRSLSASALFLVVASSSHYALAAAIVSINPSTNTISQAGGTITYTVRLFADEDGNGTADGTIGVHHYDFPLDIFGPGSPASTTPGTPAGYTVVNNSVSHAIAWGLSSSEPSDDQEGNTLENGDVYAGGIKFGGEESFGSEGRDLFTFDVSVATNAAIGDYHVSLLENSPAFSLETFSGDSIPISAMNAGTVSVTPEPGSLAMLGLASAFGAAGAYHRRRKRAKSIRAAD